MTRLDDVLAELDRMEQEDSDRRRPVKGKPGRPASAEPEGYDGPITMTIVLPAKERMMLRLVAAKLGESMTRVYRTALARHLLDVLRKRPGDTAELQWMIERLEAVIASIKERVV